MPPKRPFHPIGDILGKMLKGGKWDSKLKQYSFLSQWETIVGPQIAKHATPAIWRGNTLVVEVTHSSWLQELKMMESEVLEKIRKSCPEVTIDKIRWILH